MRNYLIESSKLKNRLSVNGIEIDILDPLPESVSLRDMLNKAFELLPSHFISGLEGIKVGNFQYLKDRKIQATYKDKKIYITNFQDNSDDMLNDFIHEIAHYVEERFSNVIYSDNKIKKEFLKKRTLLWQKLKDNKFNLNKDDFLNIKYNKKFDDLLYLTIGYDTLRNLGATLFYTPYSITSISEYFAESFEAFFMKKDHAILKRNSPILYQKNIQLMNLKK